MNKDVVIRCNGEDELSDSSHQSQKCQETISVNDAVSKGWTQQQIHTCDGAGNRPYHATKSANTWVCPKHSDQYYLGCVCPRCEQIRWAFEQMLG